MQAGRLEIEIVAEIAKLQQSMRDVERTVGKTAGQIGRDARAANDNLRNIGEGADAANYALIRLGKTSQNTLTRINAITGVTAGEFRRNAADIDAYGASLDRLRAKYNPQFAAIQQYKAGLADIRQAHKVGAISTDEMAKAIGRERSAALNSLKALRSAGSGIDGVRKDSAAAAYGMRNLGYQLQDLGVQFAQATQAGDPFRAVMMALIQQGPQIADAMDQAELSIGGLANKIAQNAAKFSVFVVGAAAGLYHLKMFTDELNKENPADNFINGLGLTAKEIKELENTAVSFGDVALGTWDVVAAGIWDVIGPAITGAKTSFDDWFRQTNENGAKLINDLIGFFVGGFNAIGAVWSKLPAAMGDIATTSANATITAINYMVKMAVEGMNGLISGANVILKKVGLGMDTITAPKIGLIENAYQGAGEAAANAWTKAFENGQKDYWGQFSAAVGEAAANRRNNRLQAQANEIIEDRSGRGSRKKAIDEEARALERAIKESTRYAEALELETSRIGKNAIEIKKMEIAANAAAAPTEALRQRILKAGEEWVKMTRAQADADFDKNVIQPLKDELALLGLVGPERELAALALEEQAFKAQAARDGITDVNAAWKEYLRLRTDIIEGESAIEREADAAKILNDQLRDMIGLLGNLGGVGGVVGGLIGIFSGNTSAVGGPLGDLLNMQTGQTRYDEKLGREIGVTIGDELSGLFDKDSDFGRAMQSLLGGAGTGLIAGGLFGFGGGKANQFGSAVGGALGEVIGEKFLTKGLESIMKGLGDFAGPLGAIAGGVFGGFLGGLFNPNRTARANITGVDSVSLAGKDSKNYGAAEGLAGSVLQGLQDIADAFGGAIGSFNTTIGVRGGDFRVNTSGTSLKKKNGALDFEDDAQAAIAYAIADAIADGAIIGIRESTKRLIEFGDDVQRQLEKALQFEGVFSELKAETDPLGYALDNLAKQFNRLEDIFAEAGATAEEYAQLEQLLEIKRKEAIESATKDLVADFQERADLEVQLLSLLGKETKALALARESELLGVKDTLKPLQQMVYQLQDARAIIDQFGPLADGLREFKAELLGGSSAGGFAFLRGQFNSTAAAAAGGDAAALAKLQEVSTEYLEAARANASSRLEYDRAVGEVLGAVDQGIFAADTQVEYAQMQIDAVNYNSEILDKMRAEMAAMQQRLVEQGETAERIMKRWEGNGMPIRADSDEPLAVQVIS